MNVRSHLLTLTVLCLSGACASAQPPQAVSASGPLGHAVTLRNRQIEIGIARTAQGFVLNKLRCLSPNRNFLKGDAAAPLWRLSLRPPTYLEKDQVSIDSAALCDLSVSTRHYRGGSEARLLWRGLSLPGEPHALDVAVAIRLDDGDSMSQWKIQVVNRSKVLGLWTVDFPLLSPLEVSPKATLATPLGWGVLTADPTHNAHYTAEYPSLFATMQFTALTDDGISLYVAPQDPAGYLKQLNWRSNAGLGYSLRNYPEDMGKPGKGYASPFPTVIGFAQGDWLDAAKVYRRWVTHRAPWAAGGSLEHSTRSPAWIKSNTVWLQSNGRGSNEPTDKLLSCLDLKRALSDVPIADQLYWWQQDWPGQKQFDEGYPDTFFHLGRPSVEPDAIRAVQAAGVRSVPYSNPNLVDARTAYWKGGGWRYAALPPEAAGRHAEWIADINRRAAAGEVVNVPMCPYMKARQDVVVQWATKMVGAFGFDGVYLDQVACTNATPCFDPSHGHPLGGGAYWVQGYRQMLGRVQKAIRKINPNAIMTTESAAEPFGVFDSYLRCNEDQGWMTPIWSAVYSGIYTSYGSYLYPEDTMGGAPYAAKFAQLFTYGGQLGWIGADLPAEPKAPWLAYLHELAMARLAAARWMGTGEYMRPPHIEGTQAVTGRWKLFASEYDVTWPAVLGSAFRADDGSVALAFTNFSGAPQSCNWSAMPSDLHLRPGTHRLRLLYQSAGCEWQASANLSGKLEMPPLSATVLLVE